MNYEQKDGMIYDPEDGQAIATMSESSTPEQAALLAAAPQQAARILELERQLENMQAMISKIKQALGETK